MTTTVPDPFALAAAAFTPREPTLADTEFPTPGSLALALDPKETRNPPHLRVLDDHLVQVASRTISRLLVTMPPQEGKSTRAVLYFVLWLLRNNPDLRIAIVSMEDGKATRWGRAIRDAITNNDLGITVREDVKAAGRWQILGHRGSVYCTGWQGSLTGEPVDVLIIDDPVKGAKEVDSPAYRDDLWDWWSSTAKPRLGPASVVVLIMTLWHPDDIAGRLIATEGDAADGGRWTVLRIPAIAEAGQPDAIGRKPDEWLPSARGRTATEWEQIRAEMPDRWWSAMYQGRPTPPAGAVWHADWIDHVLAADVPRLVRTLVMVDPSGSSGDGAAETGIVIMSLGIDGHVYVLDDRSLRAPSDDRARAVCLAAIDAGADEIVVEEDYGGDNNEALIRAAWVTVARSALAARRLSSVPRIRSVRAKAHGSKRIRAEIAAGFYQRGMVHHVRDETGSGRLDRLERQLLEWSGDGASPDRLDAVSHGVRELIGQIAAPVSDTRSRGQRLGGRR